MRYSVHMDTTVLIPAYNAESTIEGVLHGVMSALRGCEIIVIDDGSTDRTAETVQRFEGVKLVSHSTNRGYGAALKTGIRVATGDILITLDADGQHDPAGIPDLLSALEGFDMASGARQQLIHSPMWRMPGKWAIHLLANWLSSRRIPDLNCGLRAFRKDIVSKYAHLCPNGFSFSTTITLVLINRGYAVTFVPVNVQRRQGTARSTVSLATGFGTILLILRLMTLLNPMRVFLPISLLLLLSGATWGMRYVLLGQGLSIGALLLILSSLLLFGFALIADQVAELRKEKWE